MSEINYPPEEIYNPPKFGHKNIEHIILWMLFNNEECLWSYFTEKPLGFSTSTLSKYFKILKDKGYVDNYSRGHYKITSEGQKRFHEISKVTKKKRKLNYPPEVIRRKRNYDDWILWMVYNNTYCKWSDFLEPPLSINQSSLSKKMNLLLDKNFVIKENKEYRITHSGKLEYSKMLQNYDLDRQSILNEESKRVEEITKKTVKFFEENNIKDEDLQFRFLTNVLKLDYDRVKSMLTEELDFEKILLFLSINHPDQFPDYILAEDFSRRYGINQSKLEYYVDEIVENNIYSIKFFKLKVSKDIYCYFQENETLELMLRAITEKYITKFTYLSKLFSRPFDVDFIQNLILEDIGKILFDRALKEPLKKFLPNYINYLAYKIESKVELKETYDKLDAVIWQNMIDIFQLRNPEDLEYQFIGQNEVNYQIDTMILEILKPYYKSKLDSINKVIQHLIDKKEYNKALETVDSALVSNKTDVILITLKAIILCYLNRYKDVREFIDNEVKLPPENEEMDQIYILIFFLSVFSRITIGDFESALVNTNKILKIYPTHALSYATRGLSLGYNRIYKFDNEKAQEDNGLNDLDKAINLDSYKLNKALYYQLKSHILLEIKKFEDANEMIDKAITLAPKKVELYQSKSAILMYFNQYDKLLELLDRMLELFPKNEKDIKMKQASVYKQLGNLDAGFKIIDELIEKYPKDYNFLNYKAYWYQYANNEKEALHIIEELIKNEPKNSVFYDSYGEILMYFEKYEEAVKQFQKAIKMSNFGFFIYQTYIKLGICYKELENYELALENLKMGKEYLDKCFCDFETKQKWSTIADLFITDTEYYL
ncbi:MAG: tetratricopeptide repeat protein [Promethearchaeota archaeon]